MPKKEDISKYINHTFGLLSIISDIGIRNNSRYVLCKCLCGAEKQIRLSDIKIGKSTNCGCIRKEKMRSINTTHGLSKHPLNRIWMGIKERCYYKNHKHYDRYGGRGITVCDEWKNDFTAFYNWAISKGWVPGLEIDREDNDGNYEPDNCKLSTRKQNMRNTSANKVIEYDGKSLCLAEWADVTGLSQSMIKDRLNKLKWSIEKTLTTPNLNKNVDKPITTG